MSVAARFYEKPLVWIEDFFLNSLANSEFKNLQKSPDYILVPNDGALEVLKPERLKSEIIAIGHPALDSIYEKLPRKKEIREKIREELLGFADDDDSQILSVLWLPGQPEDVALESVAGFSLSSKAALYSGIFFENATRLVVVVRPHPKDEINKKFPYPIFICKGKVSKSGPKLIQFWLWKGNVQNVKTKEDFGS